MSIKKLLAYNHGDHGQSNLVMIFFKWHMKGGNVYWVIASYSILLIMFTLNCFCKSVIQEQKKAVK